MRARDSERITDGLAGIFRAQLYADLNSALERLDGSQRLGVRLELVPQTTDIVIDLTALDTVAAHQRGGSERWR